MALIVKNLKEIFKEAVSDDKKIGSKGGVSWTWIIIFWLIGQHVIQLVIYFLKSLKQDDLDLKTDHFPTH